MSIFPDASPERPVYLVCECGERLTLTAPPDAWPIACAACGKPVRRVDPETVRRPEDGDDPLLLPGPDGESALPSVRRGGALRRADQDAELPGFGEEGGTVEIRRRTFTGTVVTQAVEVRAPETWGMETLALALWLATAMALMIGHVMIADGDLTAPGMLLQSALFAAATTGFVLFQKTSVAPTLQAPASTGFWLLLAVKLLPVTVGGVFLYFFLLQKAYGLDLGDPTADLLRDPDTSLPLLVVAIGVLPGFFEELGFRGWMQSIWRKMVPPRRALLLTAVAFTVVHFSLLSVGWLLPMGIYLGWLRERSGSIWPGVVAHMGHNTAVVILARVLA